ncbi:N-acetylmuramic acid 6-phosphate etherase [Lunatimonas lonarensis]|uniref:N-acetylmuramic acid 6-phosphate etherase n=1 Tax=Lunatimonas lonarensis TaxID=1232681 RepID=R7ZUX5_9BACT|nr:N-acetylmuramic acid 6-phosphate etherase [Lunatimonas lonarensis]EON77833.1 N-acetylmuramic acid 6-phosphate etherase [Lunatimonas lonarensis]
MSTTTESSSFYDNLEQMSISELLANMNKEDQTVPLAVAKSLPQIERLVAAIVPKMEQGGRLFYIGAGTSGRLGILDASECPPTYGVPHDLVIGIIAGGDTAIRKAVENAEDDPAQAWEDIQKFGFNENDSVIGIAASGTTPYVIGGLKAANEAGLLSGCITCNAGSPLAAVAQLPVEVVVGPEFVTGSTRMKSGTAQKLVLNMISTSVMIKLGKVKGNKMVDMQLSNEKLVNRGTRMIMDATGLPAEKAKEMLLEHGSVRAAVNAFEAGKK